MYSNQIPVVVERMYTKEELIMMIQEHSDSDIELKQYLINSLT